jgi:hypothetical protein
MQWNGYYHDLHASVDHYQASMYCGFAEMVPMCKYINYNLSLYQIDTLWQKKNILQ